MNGDSCEHCGMLISGHTKAARENALKAGRQVPCEAYDQPDAASPYASQLDVLGIPEKEKATTSADYASCGYRRRNNS